MIRFDSSFDDGNNVWFIGNENNIIYCMDYDLNIWMVLDLNLNRECVRWGSPYCTKYDDLMICLPSREKKIKLVNLHTNEISEIKVEISADRYNIPYCLKRNNDLWCLSTSSGELIKIDIQKKKQMNTIALFKENKDVFTGDMVYDNRFIYAVYPNTNCIIEFELESETRRTKVVNTIEQGFSTILLFDNKRYLTGYRNVIYVVSGNDNNSVEEIDLEGKMEWSVENEGVTQPRFRNSYLINNEWALFIPKETENYRTDNIVIVNCLSREIKVFDLNITKSERHAGEILVFSHFHNGEIVIYDYMIDNYISINVFTEKIKILTYKIDHIKMQKFFERWNARKVIIEDNFIGLTNLIRGLQGESREI